MSNVFVYKLRNDGGIENIAKEVGFNKIIFTNGFQSSLGQSWTINL